MKRYYDTAHWRALRVACLRRDRYCCTVPGCDRIGTHADHVVSRPSTLTEPCELDHLDNLRTLCSQHDTQVKEQRAGDITSRKHQGKPTLRGCDADGRALDPNSVWNVLGRDKG